MAVRKLNSSLTPAQRMQMDRVQRAKKAEPKWDEFGIYAEKCGELARSVGADPGVVYEEFCERSATRVIVGGLDVAEGERLAYEDTQARFEAMASRTVKL